MVTETQSTVVAAFRDRTSAQSAVDDLNANGFVPSAMFDRAEGLASGSGSIKSWFKSLFGEDEQEGAADKGSVYVTVDVQKEKVGRAVEIMTRYSPVDLRHDGSEDATELRSSMNVDADLAYPEEPEAAARESVRVYPRMANERMLNENDDYRSHFAQTYGAGGEHYSAYLPSYEYGEAKAAEAFYQGKTFAEVEADIRGDYEKRYAESSWDKMKDAIRYGWERMTGQASKADHQSPNPS